VNTACWLDREDRIVRVSGSWDTFALENEGEKAVSERVTGRKLFEFITGDISRMWMSAIIGLVRVSGGELERPYRCDTPYVRRYMRMRVFSEISGELCLEHILLKKEKRSKPVFFVPAVSIPKNPLERRCSTCGRIFHDGEWIEADSIPGLPSDGGEIPVVYTICEECWKMAGDRSDAHHRI
jgi:hypothetical protein